MEILTNNTYNVLHNKSKNSKENSANKAWPKDERSPIKLRHQQRTETGDKQIDATSAKICPLCIF